MRIRTQTLTRVGAALLASTLLVTGCASSNNDEDKSDDTSSLSKEEIYATGIYGDENPGEPKQGGQLVIGEYSEARSLDPTVTIANGTVGGSIMAAVYDTLMRYDHEAQEFVPKLAESLSTEDNQTWTLKLREGIKFSDGTPLNAKAVVGSIGYYMENNGFNVLLLATHIKEMKPVDELTVEFTLNSPWASFENQLAAGAGMILAPAAIKNGQDGFEPIGAGPFVFKSYKPGEELILERNEDYGLEKAHLDSLRFTFPSSDGARVDAVKNGDLDQTSLRNARFIEEMRLDGAHGSMVSSGIANMFPINNREGYAGHDPRIRKAITMALDPQLIADRTQEGHGLATRNIFSPSATYYSEIDELQSDVAEAKKLVEEAKADGAITELTFITQSDQGSKTLGVTIQALLKDIGIDVEVEYLNSVADQVNRIYVTHDYGMATGSLSVPVESPYAALATNLLSTSPSNSFGYESKEMDALIAKMQNVTGDELTAVAAEVNELWQEDNPAAVVFAGGFFFPWGEHVHGITASSENIHFYDKAWKS